MKTARLQLLTTPAFRDRLRKEAKKAGVSMAELVRTRCEGSSNEEEQLVAELAAQLSKEVRRAQSSLRSSLAEANAMLDELRAHRERRRSAERV
ncbi:MAG: hypothetical protein WCD47_06730 [Candidatus Sulfotelmatobacter sp.]